MAFEFNAAPTVSLFGIADPRLSGQGTQRAGTPPVLDAEVVDRGQSASDRTGIASVEIRVRQRASAVADLPILKGPISYGADGKPRYILQGTPGSILSVLV